MAEAAEAFDDTPRSAAANDTVGAVIARRFSRREVLKGSLGVAASTLLFGGAALTARPANAAEARAFDFAELKAGVDETHHVANGYTADILIRWGDPLFAGTGPFDPMRQTAQEQVRRFGYNNDYIAYFPLDGSTRGLLCTNHEYVNPEIMFPGVGGRPDRNHFVKITREHVEVEIAAHGVSVLEVALRDGKWQPVLDSRFNRRITASTEMTVDGPAASHARMKTAADPTGLKLWGTLNNCAGGQTPWGTYLTGEENFHGYFWTDKVGDNGRRLNQGFGGVQQKSYERYGVPANWVSWGRHHDRFNVEKEANECNRFGWIVEIDPIDPQSRPVKHTALGRCSHEGAEMIVNKDGRVVVYTGDDARFE
jgi:secreted PhoX family phosphatase